MPQLQKLLVDARIVGQLGMESCCHDTSLPHQHGISAVFRQDFYALTHALDPRRANKDHLQRFAAERAGGFDDGGIDLASVSVAADRNVDRIEALLMRVLDLFGQHDRSGAGAERGLAVHEITQLLKSFFTEELQKGTRLAPWNNQAIDLAELLRFADEYNFCAQFFQAAAMRIEIALEGKNTNLHKLAFSYQPSALS